MLALLLAQTSNVYLQLVRDLNSPDDFKFLYTNIARLLTNPLTTQTYPPYSAPTFDILSQFLPAELLEAGEEPSGGANAALETAS